MKKIFSFLAAVLFAGSMFAETAVLAYPAGSGTTNMNATDNYASVLGLDDSYFTVTAIKGSPNNNIGLNNAGDIRLYVYNGVGNTLVVSMKGGKINSIKLDIKKTTTFEVKAGEGDDAVVVTEKDGAFAIDAARFTIQNTTASGTNQLQLNKITIEYELDGSILAKPVIGPDVTSFEGSLDVTISAAEGAQIYYTTDGNDPTASDELYVKPFTITTTTVVKAVAAKDDQLSAIAEKKFSLIDTVSVTEARALIDAKDEGAHYVRGVVKGNVFDPNKTFNHKLAIWMTDEVNSADSLEAYQIYAGPNDQQWESLVAAKELIGEGDTILVYAPKLMFYAAKNYYETDGGYFVEVLGKFIEDETIVYDTLTVEEAKAAADALPDNGSSEKKVYVEGFAKHVAKYDALKGNQTFFMADEFTEDIDSTFEAYLATPKKEGAAYPVLEGDKVRAFGYLKKYIDTKNNNKVILEITDPLVSFISEVEGDRTITIPTMDTLTVAQALARGAELADNGVTEDQVVIEGYVSFIKEYYSETNKNETFWIADSKSSTAKTNAEGAFYVYRGKPDTEKELGQGAHVYVTCKIKKYKPASGDAVIENNEQNCAVKVIEQGVVEEVEPANVAQAVAIGAALNSGETTTKRYEITGYVSYISEVYSEWNKNESFWISDDPTDVSNDKATHFYVYGGRPSTKAELGLHAKVKFVTTIKNYNGTIENDVAVDVEVLEPGQPLDIPVYTVEDAFAIGNELEGSAESDIVTVMGYAVKSKQENNGKLSWFLSDDPTDEKGDIEAYKPNADKTINQGDYISLTGRMTKYCGSSSCTVEISYGIVKHETAPKIDTIEVSVAEALAIGENLEVEQKTKEVYKVIGYVALIREGYQEDTGIMSVLLSDDEKASVGTFFAEEMKIDAAVEVHEKIEVIGKIMKTESDSGNELVGIWGGSAKRFSPEGIEQIVLTEKAQKVMIDGVMYIVRDNKLFDVRGTRVR